MNCPFCNAALAYDDGTSRYTCPNGCVVQWSLEEMYEALAAEVARLREAYNELFRITEARQLDAYLENKRLTAENARLRAQLDGVRIYLEGIDKGVAKAMQSMPWMREEHDEQRT